MALENWDETNHALNRMLTEYSRRREFLVPALNELGLRCEMPEGAFYAFPDVRKCFNERIKTSQDFADLLLKEAHIVTTDGASFGVEGFVRVSYAAKFKRLQEAIERIRRVINL
jgi:aspartate/methionine/tyrosine aminotransferase